MGSLKNIDYKKGAFMKKYARFGGRTFPESCIFEKGAEIGNGTKIWHNTHVRETAQIGIDCMIGDNCFIAGYIGDRCKIQNGVQIFDGVTIENDVFIGPGNITTNISRPRAFID